MDSKNETASVKRVVLIANYGHDQLTSMELFAKMLSRELSAAGVAVQIVRPKPVLGNLKPGGYGLGKWLGYIDKWLLFPLSIPSVVRQCRGEGVVFHILDHSNAPYLKYFRRVPTLITCHDLLAIRSAIGEVPENPTRWAGRRLQGMIAKGLGGARNVACVSTATMQDYKRLFMDSEALLTHIPMCMNAAFNRISKKELDDRLECLKANLEYADGRPVDGDLKYQEYFLHVGSNAWYKNRLGLLHAYSEARRHLPTKQRRLVLVGPPLSHEQFRFVRNGGFVDEIVIRIGATQAELEALYNGTIALVFPSLAEGFGWPPVEAQACGSLVITSNEEPMLSVSGPAAMHLDPRDTDALAEAIVEVSKLDEGERGKRIASSQQHLKQFEPKVMVKQYLNCYANLLAGQ